MKYFNGFAVILLACTMVICTVLLCKELEESSIGSVTISSSPSSSNDDSDEVILSPHQVLGFLKINEVEDLMYMIEAGELQGTYFTMKLRDGTDEYFFVREKLSQWCVARAEAYASSEP